MINDMSCVQLFDLQIDYGGKVVYKNLNLNIDISALTILTGSKPGCCDALLRTIAGTLPILDGQIRLWGAPVNQIPRRTLNSQVCFVPRQQQTYFPYSVFDIIMQGCEPRLKALQSPNESDRTLALMLMKRLKIEKLINRESNDLSAADRQRVLLCRALMQDARLLLLEEPVKDLGIDEQQEIMAIFRNLAQQGGKTIVITAEDPWLALDSADLLVVFDDQGITDIFDRRHPMFLDHAKIAISHLPIADSNAKLNSEKSEVSTQNEDQTVINYRKIRDLF